MRPHEETWTVLDDPGDSRVHVLRAPGDAALEIHDYNIREEGVATATLAAQAPRMARLLLKAAGPPADKERGCIGCGTWQEGHHYPECPVFNVLRDAGVLP